MPALALNAWPGIRAAFRIIEHWHHSAGCRRWLVVERDNAASHEVYSVTDASDYAKEAAR